jgi:RNA polymerase sigma factor (sigma-70 family)
MLTEPEAQQLMIDLIKMRDEIKSAKKKDTKLIAKYKAHQNICMEKFKYLVSMRTGRYKAFSNYDDLNQEGFEALTKAMANYKPNKGSFFWWAHKYIDTRISRSANLHTTIRFPLKVAKENTPHKESVLPLLIEERYCPDKELEEVQTTHMIQSAMSALSDEQKQIVSLAYGFDGDKTLSINKICKKLNLSRATVQKTLNSAMDSLKESIKL